jgi:hypothetical protein
MGKAHGFKVHTTPVIDVFVVEVDDSSRDTPVWASLDKGDTGGTIPPRT